MHEKLEKTAHFNLKAFSKILSQQQKGHRGASKIAPLTKKFDWMPPNPRKNKAQTGLSRTMLQSLINDSRGGLDFVQKEVRAFLLLSLAYKVPVRSLVFGNRKTILEDASEILKLGLESMSVFPKASRNVNTDSIKKSLLSQAVDIERDIDEIIHSAESIDSVKEARGSYTANRKEDAEERIKAYLNLLRKKYQSAITPHGFNLTSDTLGIKSYYATRTLVSIRSNSISKKKNTNESKSLSVDVRNSPLPEDILLDQIMFRESMIFRSMGILSPSGFGKSTLLRQLACKLIEKTKDSLSSIIVPILFKLKEFKERDSFFLFIKKELMATIEFTSKNDSLKVTFVLLLDGLDEMPKNRDEDFIETYHSIIQTNFLQIDQRKFPLRTTILTSNSEGIDRCPSLPFFRGFIKRNSGFAPQIFEIFPLNLMEQLEYVRNFFISDKAKANRVVSRIKNSYSFQDACSVPMFLFSLCWTFSTDDETINYSNPTNFLSFAINKILSKNRDFKNYDRHFQSIKLEIISCLIFRLKYSNKIKINEALDILSSYAVKKAQCDEAFAEAVGYSSISSSSTHSINEFIKTIIDVYLIKGGLIYINHRDEIVSSEYTISNFLCALYLSKKHRESEESGRVFISPIDQEVPNINLNETAISFISRKLWGINEWTRVVGHFVLLNTADTKMIRQLIDPNPNKINRLGDDDRHSRRAAVLNILSSLDFSTDDIDRDFVLSLCCETVDIISSKMSFFIRDRMLFQSARLCLNKVLTSQKKTELTKFLNPLAGDDFKVSQKIVGVVIFVNSQNLALLALQELIGIDASQTYNNITKSVSNQFIAQYNEKANGKPEEIRTLADDLLRVITTGEIDKYVNPYILLRELQIKIELSKNENEKERIVSDFSIKIQYDIDPINKIEIANALINLATSKETHKELALFYVCFLVLSIPVIDEAYKIDKKITTLLASSDERLVFETLKFIRKFIHVFEIEMLNNVDWLLAHTNSYILHEAIGVTSSFTYEFELSQQSTIRLFKLSDAPPEGVPKSFIENIFKTLEIANYNGSINIEGFAELHTTKKSTPHWPNLARLIYSKESPSGKDQVLKILRARAQAEDYFSASQTLEACSKIGRDGLPNTLDIIELFLQNKNQAIVCKAFDALMSFGDLANRRSIIRLINDIAVNTTKKYHPDLIAKAIILAKEIGGDSVTSELISLFKVILEWDLKPKGSESEEVIYEAYQSAKLSETTIKKSIELKGNIYAKVITIQTVIALLPHLKGDEGILRILEYLPREWAMHSEDSSGSGWIYPYDFLSSHRIIKLP